MCNEEVRSAIRKSGLKYWEVAAAVGIADTTFSKWLRTELEPSKRHKVIEAIHTLSKKRG